GIFNPLIALLFNSGDLESAGVTLRAAEGDAPAIVLSWGLVISAVIKFVLIAAVVYFALIVPMNYLRKLGQRRKEKGEEAEVAPTEAELLTEIRDLLKR